MTQLFKNHRLAKNDGTVIPQFCTRINVALLNSLAALCFSLPEESLILVIDCPE